MNFTEHAGKEVLKAHGIPVPEGLLARTPDEARAAAARIGPCVVKAQVPTGKRGKAGGIKLAATPDAAAEAARNILAMSIADHPVEAVLIDPQVDIAREMYAAVLNDPDSKSPLLLFSPEGGMDIEELADAHPDALLRFPVDIRHGPDQELLAAAVRRYDPPAVHQITEILLALYRAYAATDAELVEINPLAITRAGKFVALDCKLAIDDSAIPRRHELSTTGVPDRLTALETRARELHLKYIELDGEVGVLANGAGLTMTTMDAIRHYGGRPANFMEIGGDSYTKAKPALEIVLANPRVKCLLVNFCGAFARTDVMAEGVVGAWLDLKPKIPIIFTIHGTGEDEAIALVKSRLGIEPHDLMDDAVKAAVAAASA
ncbi:MAG TPA: acetate--CoA ligase family protein [Hyphomicrobiaceae bacterium]|nr:acetate--CoA ligase family protein [Hyphomicrobiaceae bacterium]